jgi:two-component SAPR family response regulator
MSLDQHLCMFFEHAQDIADLCAPAIQEATRSGCRGIFVSNGEHVAGAGMAAGLLGAVEVVQAGSLGMRDTPISIHSIIAKLRDLCAAKAGRREVCLLLIDMSWLLDAPSGIAHQGEVETAIHQFAVTSVVRAVCLYNGRFFPEGMLLDALRTHPYVFDRLGLRGNPHFLPPQVYLSGDLGGQLRSWLGSLGTSVATSWRDPLLIADRVEVDAKAGVGATTAPSVSAPSLDLEQRRALHTSISRQDDPSTEHRWKVRSFGNLRIYRQDGTPVQWNVAHGATVKTKTIFAFLLSRGTTGATAEELADLLWPEAESANQGLNRLYHAIHCLRIALDPEWVSNRESRYLACHDHRYVLTLPDGTWVDQPMFEQFCKRGEQLLRENQLEGSLACHVVAEKLYSGPLYADIPLKYAENAEYDWCWSRRYWLEEMHVKMLAYSASIHRQLGDAGKAVECAEKAIRISPCYELAHQELMRVFHLTGRRDALDRQYRLCFEALRRYEECAPSSETRALFQLLRSD